VLPLGVRGEKDGELLVELENVAWWEDLP